MFFISIKRAGWKSGVGKNLKILSKHAVRDFRVVANKYSLAVLVTSLYGIWR